MANSRLVAKNLLGSKEFALLQGDAALAFLMLTPHWDRDGLIDGDAVWELPKLMYYRDELGKRMLAFVENWEKVGLVIPYTAGERRVIYFKKFRVYNPNIFMSREAPSRFPAPPNYTRHASGLIPDNENDLIDLISDLDPRSNYRIALEKALDAKLGTKNAYENLHSPNSLSNHDLSLRGRESSRPLSVDQHNQDQSVVVVDQSDHSPQRFVMVRGVQGGISSLGDFSPEQLVEVAWGMGSLLNLHMDWVGYDEFLKSSNSCDLERLIEWIAFHLDRSMEANEKIVNWSGLMISYIRSGRSATLRTKQREGLLQSAYRICYPEAEAATESGEEISY